MVAKTTDLRMVGTVPEDLYLVFFLLKELDMRLAGWLFGKISLKRSRDSCYIETSLVFATAVHFLMVVIAGDLTRSSLMCC